MKVGDYFLELLDKHFPQQHKLRKILNKSTVKVSYSCTKKKKKKIINSHNKKVLHQNQPCPNEQKCNCIKKELCAVNGSCQTIIKILYMKPPSHAMNKTMARTFI